MSTAPLSALFDRNVAADPEAPFVVTLDGTWSYADAAARVGALRTELRRRGIGAGDRVLLLAPNSPAFVFGWLAAAGLDATIVPVHGELPDAGLRRIVADSGAIAALGTGELLAARGDAFEIGSERRIDLEAAGAGNGDAADLASVATAEHPCAILYTSGTTGPPKGAVLGHRAYYASAAKLAAGLGVTPADRILTALPLFHANPQFYVVATALYARASIALLERFKAATFMRDAGRLGATGFTYVGTILTMLTRAGEPTEPHSLRFCVGGGAPAPVWRELDRWGVRVHELYGLTETAGFVTLNTLDDYREGTCGRTRGDYSLRVVDGDGEPIADGERGEIVVRPERRGVMFDGYFGQPDVTLDRVRDLWFRTGDAGWLDEDGFLYFAGRLDHRVRRGGENIDTPSVEVVLNEHPEIDEAAVVGVPDEVMGEELKAVLVADPGFDPWALREFLEGRLPRLAWPRYVELRDALPKTSTEKVIVAQLDRIDETTIDLRNDPRPLHETGKEGEHVR